MTSTVRRIAVYAIVLFTVLVVLFVAAQIAQLAALAGAVHPTFGLVVGVALILLVLGLVAVPVVAIARLDRPLVPPREASGPAYDAFVSRSLASLRRNRLLADEPLETEDDLHRAFALLEAEAERVGRRYASQVFVGTAVSQYGSLDALIVGVMQARMIWEIAHVYQRRPSLRQLAYLYGNVLATSVVASQVGEVDLSEYVQPVLVGAVGQTVASLPVVSAVSGIVSNATFRGSVNAFLTLRVAIVTIEFAKATVRPDRRDVWRTAVLRAGRLVSTTIREGSRDVSRAFAEAAARGVGSAAAGAGRAVVAGGRRVGGVAVPVSATVAGFGKGAASAAWEAAKGVRRKRRTAPDAADASHDAEVAGAGDDPVDGGPADERGTGSRTEEEPEG